MRRLIFEAGHEQFRDSVRRFFQNEIAPHAEKWRAQGYVDRWAYTKAGELGYLLMWADEQYGGAGVHDFRYEQIVYEENIRHGEIGFYINLHSGLVAPYIGELGNEEQKSRFLPGCISGETILGVAMTEPGAGSDLAGSLLSGKRAAAIMSLIQSARINGYDPYAYLKDVLSRLPTQRASEIELLFPHQWIPAQRIKACSLVSL